MKLSDYVAQFLVDEGIKYVFAISGGASLHLIHSIDSNPDIKFICPHHEQAGAMAADGLARATGSVGVAVGTSGPGATNLITGICCSFYDSVAVLYITGQVSTTRMVGETAVRQIGFQETPIVEICRPITKFATQVLDPQSIKAKLQEAIYLARSGRPGPVLVDIPDDVQRAFIDEESLRSFDPPLVKNTRVYRSANESIDQLLHHIERSKRPIIIAGWGVHLSKTVEKFRRFVAQAQIPVALTWGGADLLDCNNKYRVGTFGTHGQRHANFAVQNSDFVLSLGSRLDTKSTGSPITSFARGAWKAVVDIDVYELGKFEKFGLQIDCLIEDTLDNAINLLLERGFSGGNSDDWMKKLSGWKNKFTQFDRPKVSSDYVNPYVFMDKLSEVCPPETQLVIDTGCTVAWAMQALNPRDTTRLFHDFNNTAMGWALPASIGISLADKSRLVFCLVGDGSLMMNLQELATVCGYQIPIKIICFNNDGYSMIKQTQDQWLGSQYLASSEEGGVFFPNLSEIAQAFGLEIYNIRSDKEIEPILKSVVDTSAPTFCNVCVDPGIRVSPQVKFGRPNEDPEPLLPRDIFLREMIVDPQEKSEDSV